MSETEGKNQKNQTPSTIPRTRGVENAEIQKNQTPSTRGGEGRNKEINYKKNIKSISSLHSDIDLEKSQNSKNNFPVLENSEKNSENQNLSNPEPPHPPTPLAPASAEVNNSFAYLDEVAEKIRNQEPVILPEWVNDPDRAEFFKFLLYWTEPDTRGKIRAKKEKVFEIRRRFAYWLSRSKPSNVSPNQARNRI